MKKKLKDICTQVRGVSYKPSDLRDENSGVPILRANNIQDTGIVLDELVYVDSSKVHSEQYLLTDDIVICASSGSKNLVGKAATFKSDLSASFGAFCKVVRINNSDDLCKAYIQQYFQSKIYRNAISESSAGANINNIKTEDIEALEIPLPSKEEQIKIAAELDTIQSAIDNKKQQLALLDEAVKSEFVEMFGENPVESGKWKVETLGEIGKVSMCKRILREQTTPEGDIPFYKIGTFGKKADAYISKELYNEFKSKYSYPKKGSILISASGTIGRAVVFDGEPAYFQDSNIVWIDNDETKVLNSFLQFWYGTNPWKITQGGTISRLYNSNISEANVIIPPLEVQQSFAAFVQKIDKSKFVVKQQIADLQELLDNKMQ